MVERIRPRRRIMRKFRISELSAVDRPAQAHARMTIMKRADDDPDVAKKYDSASDLPASVRDALPAAAQRQFVAAVNSALDGGASEESAFRQAWGAIKNAGWHKDRSGAWVKKGYPGECVAIARDVAALDFDAVMAEAHAREAGYRVGDTVHTHWNALQRSLTTIADDDDVPPAEKAPAMRASVAQFIASLSEEIRDDVSKALAAVPAFGDLLEKEEGDGPMTAAEKQQLDELQKTVADLTKKLEAATASDPAKKAAEVAGELEKAQQQVDDLTKKLAAAEAARTEATAKASMSDDERRHMEGMDDSARKEFMGLSPDERKKKMAKAADEDPVVYKAADGTEFRKSAGDHVVALARRADESDRRAAEEARKREDAELAKRADEGVMKTFAGESSEKVEVLRAISKMDEAPRRALEKMLEAGGKAIAAAFETIGHRDATVAKSADEFEKHVSDIAARDKVSRTAAMTKARQEFPEAFRAYRSSDRDTGN